MARRCDALRRHVEEAIRNPTSPSAAETPQSNITAARMLNVPFPISYSGTPVTDEGEDTDEMNLDRIMKPKGRARSGSPAVMPNPTGMFGQQDQQQQQPQPTMNSFTPAGFSFAFGGQQQPQSNEPSNGFQFGAQPQQNGITNPFTQSAAPSFGSTFNSTTTQPQQNGFAPSTSLFSQPSSQQTASNFSFGQSQSQPSQQNGTATPATSFGGFGSQAPASTQNGTGTSFNFGGASQQEKQDPKPSNPFAGFNTAPADSNKPNSLFSGGFGQKPQENGGATNNLFSGGLGSSTLENGGQKSAENGQGANKAFAFGSQTAQENGEKSNNNTSNIFGQQAFGQKPAESTERFTTPFSGFGMQKSSETSDEPKPAANPFANFAQSKPTENGTKSLFASTEPDQQASKSTSNIFSASQASAATSSGPGLFGAKPPSTNLGKSTGSIFDSLAKKDSSHEKFVFSSSDPSQVYNGEDDEEEENGQTREASGSQPPKPAAALFNQNTTSSIFKTSASQLDASMTTPEATPKKSLFQTAATPGNAMFSSTPATQPPRSLFDRVDKPAPTTDSGGQSEETPKASFFGTTTAPLSTAKPSFAPSASSTTLFQTSKAQPGRSSTTTAPPPTKSTLFQSSIPPPSTPAAAPTVAASTFQAPPATAPVARFSSNTFSSANLSAKASVSLTDAQRKDFHEMNEGLIAHLKSQDTSKDWSGIFRYALVLSAQIAGRAAPTDGELDEIAAAPAANQSKTSTPAFPNSSASSTKSTNSGPVTKTSAGSLFAQTPKAATSSSLFTNPPATAPATKKRPLDEDADEGARAPATEKRSKLNESAYPKLPESASNTAKLFASTLDKSAPASGTPKSANSTKSLFSASASVPTASGTSSSGGFKPVLSATASTPSGISSGGFKPNIPTTSSAGSSFLSSFGSLAAKEEEKERKKRKDSDYDSDEETEEQWEKRDREEQEAKRKKIEEMAKASKGFPVSAPTSATAASAEKAQSTPDKTWTPETPIKFNFAGSTSYATTTPAGAPPKFGATFGASTSSTAGKLAPPPSLGFNASSSAASVDSSRAVTPGVATDGGTSTADDGEPSDELNVPQQSDDVTGLLPEERAANEVLAELKKVRAQKFEFDPDKNKKIWKEKAGGDFYLLKDKTTGKTRVLARGGAGRIIFNHMPNKGATFQVHPKKDTMVIANVFVDHMYTTPSGPGSWIFTLSDADDAAKMAQVLSDGTPT
jgi:hypothetical protein